MKSVNDNFPQFFVILSEKLAYSWVIYMKSLKLQYSYNHSNAIVSNLTNNNVAQ